ncbi:MAG TPA: hypothetical protein VKE70_36065 [Candidatus Solibacter sp.]|nr:hypothetical protein [Candidatus Solibacter sp.]
MASDREFVIELRDAIQRYLSAVDAWEAKYQKYYRMPGAHHVSDDLAEEQAEYEVTRRALEPLLPRARGLCFKHGLRDPFPTLVRTTLGEHAPQSRDTSAVGRSERLVVTDVLMQLDAACQEFPKEQTETPADEPSSRPSGNWLRRLVDYLY